MCKVKTPKMPALPPPRAMAQSPQRSAATLSRVTAGMAPGQLNQTPAFQSAIIAKLGGVPTVLGNYGG